MFRRLRRASVQIDPAELDESDYERSGDVNHMRSPAGSPRHSFENGLISRLPRQQSPLAHVEDDSAGTNTSSFDSDDRASIESLEEWDEQEEHESAMALPGQAVPVPPMPSTASTASLAEMDTRAGEGARSTSQIPDPEPVADVPSDLKCCICLNLLNDPRTIPCEAHHMACKSCLLGWLEERLTCPLDKEPIDPEMICLVPPMVSRILGSVKVCCGHKHQNNGTGCTWQGEFSEYVSHIERRCKFVRVRCAYARGGCPITILRKDFDAHAAGCEYRRVSCKFCGAMKSFRELETHIAAECSKTPVDCPNKCAGGTGILRESLQDHLNICPDQPVPCVFGHTGCGMSTRRKDVERHIEDNMALHLVMAMKKIDDDETRITELEKQMKEKDTMIADLQLQLRQLQPHHRVQWRVNKSMQNESFSFKSPMFDFAGVNWCLSIKRKARSREYLSVYLHKCSHPNTSLSVQFSVRGVNWKDETLSIGEETTEVFKGVTAWGWSNMIEVWLLGDRRHGFIAPDGSLVIEADLRLSGGLVLTQLATPASASASNSSASATPPRERMRSSPIPAR